MADTKPPPRTTHAKFSTSDADVVLVSSDNVEFKVHKVNLIAHSVFFRDLFGTATASGGKDDEIPMAEKANVLEGVLPYCYPDCLDPLDMEQPITYAIARTSDKYQIGRGLDAVASACRVGVLQHPSDYFAVLIKYLFASNFRRQELAQAVASVLAAGFGVEDGVRVIADVAKMTQWEDDGRLLDLLRRREAAYDCARETSISLMLIQNLEAHSTSLSVRDVAAAMRVWRGSRQFTTVSRLREYLRLQGCTNAALGDYTQGPWAWLPWEEVEYAISALPTSL